MISKITYLFTIFLIVLTASCSLLEKASIKQDEFLMEQAEKAIQNSPQLQEIDKVCKDIKLPANSQFIWKGGLDDEVITITYHYFSNTEFREARSIFIDYFKAHQWRLVKETDSIFQTLEFRNDKYRVNIQHGGMGKRVNYSFNCSILSSFIH